MANSLSSASPVSVSAPAPAKIQRPFPSAQQWILALSICLGAGVLSVGLSWAGLREWFPALIKPTWAPPDWIFAPFWKALSQSAQFLTDEVGRGFGPIWLVLFLTQGASLAYLWAAPRENSNREWALRWFWAQLALNLVWSAAFFAWRSPGWGYVLICTQWFALAALLWSGSKVSRAATVLALPIFAWVTFASCLNFGILGYNVLKPKVEAMDANPKNQDPYYRMRKPGPQPTPRQLD